MLTALEPSRFTSNTAGCLSLFLHDDRGGSVHVAFHPSLNDDALDALDALIDEAVALRDAYQREVFEQAHADQYQRDLLDLEDETHDQQAAAIPSAESLAA